jgi:predicted MFS family arabinose efflux permease
MKAPHGFVDPSPLRVSAAWRRLWIGTTVSGIGGQMTTVAVLYQVWHLTGSAAWVGVLGLANAVPMLVFGLAGGGLADTADRRRLVLLTTSGLVAVGVLLAAQAPLPGAGLGRLWLLLGLVAVKTCFSALGAPARRSFTALLLPRELVGAGVALDHVAFQVSMLVGPAIAGVVLAAWGVAACYALDVLSFAVGFYGVWRLPALPPAVGRDEERGGQARLVAEGWRYVVRQPVLRGAVATDLLATVLAMPISLFPAVNAQRYGGSPQTLGLFLSAIAVGGIVAGGASGLVTRAWRPGAVMVGAACVWGAGLAAFGLAGPLWLALICLAVAGAADTVSVISRGTLLQLATDDAHRGRVSSVELVVGVGGPDLGNLRGGLVAGLTSPAAALVSGGLLCLLGIAAVAATGRDLLRFALVPDKGDVLAGLEEDLAEGPVRR